MPTLKQLEADWLDGDDFFEDDETREWDLEHDAEVQEYEAEFDRQERWKDED